ncbi:hypothetical protein HYH03_004935 [Edaphochlamys debaryana]|uniref:Disease resistance R13L4/SHOC-2-like LRR domain-containing protein n=1 Tax=Edaphochlamys debaryana TaxID=47281 RepID=A0A836C2S4_9CHLO|nr:hypothetical protein HYH03_004935 [Edaphochlamys debaryana]|eukprot:KAG2496929.1 hypothetical protein HYH03_004935 [Edaphochlamys debaryana]
MARVARPEQQQQQQQLLGAGLDAHVLGFVHPGLAYAEAQQLGPYGAAGFQQYQLQQLQQQQQQRELLASAGIAAGAIARGLPDQHAAMAARGQALMGVPVAVGSVPVMAAGRAGAARAHMPLDGAGLATELLAQQHQQQTLQLLQAQQRQLQQLQQLQALQQQQQQQQLGLQQGRAGMPANARPEMILGYHQQQPVHPGLIQVVAQQAQHPQHRGMAAGGPMPVAVIPAAMPVPQAMMAAAAGDGAPRLSSAPTQALPPQLLQEPPAPQQPPLPPAPPPQQQGQPQPQQPPQQQAQQRHRPRAVRPLSAAAVSLLAGSGSAGGDTTSRASSSSSARLPLSGSSLALPLSGSCHNPITAFGSPGTTVVSSSPGPTLASGSSLPPSIVSVAGLVGPGGAGAGGCTTGGTNGTLKGDSSTTERIDDLDVMDDPVWSDGEGARSVADSEDFVSPNHPIADTAEDWSSLTAALIARVLGVLAPTGALPLVAPSMRLVCRHWRAVVDAHLEVLAPSVMKIRSVITRFASLRVLHLDHCANIRNRDLLVLARSPTAAHLHTLTLGDDRARPWVSNRGVACVCRIRSLSRLTLRDCMSLTNRGLAPLSSLTGLTSLSLRGCRKLTNHGLEALRSLTLLQRLSLFGVVRISDKGMAPIAALPALRSLELGHTRVRDEGLGVVARMGGLRSLTLVREEVSDAGVRQLSALAGLTRLVLRDTVEVSGETLAVLVPALKELQVLDLQRNWSFNNVQLARCLGALAGSSSLTSLDLRATWVADDGVAALGRIPGLRRLALSPQHEHWVRYLTVLPQLRQLTSLALGNLPILPYQVLEALAALPNLQELDLSEPPPPCMDGPGAGGGAGSGASGGGLGFGGSAAAAAVAAVVCAKEPLRPFALAALARLSALRHLDLSRRHVLPDQALFLSLTMPSLERLVLMQCALPSAALTRLWLARPGLVVVSGHGSAGYGYYTASASTLQALQQGGGEVVGPLDDMDSSFAV